MVWKLRLKTLSHTGEQVIALFSLQLPHKEGLGRSILPDLSRACFIIYSKQQAFS